MIELNENQQKIYDRLISMLGELFKTNRDELNFSILAYHIDLVNVCQAEIEQIGMNYESDSGYQQSSPAVGLIDKSLKEIIKIGSLYGLSAMAAQKLAVEEKTEIIDDIGNEL